MIERVRAKPTIARISAKRLLQQYEPLIARVLAKPKIERVRPMERVRAVVKPKEIVTAQYELWIEDRRVSVTAHEKLSVAKLPALENEARKAFMKMLADPKNVKRMVLMFFVDDRGPYRKARGSMRGINGRLMRALGIFDGAR